jgi:hypothetical protein
MRFEDDRPGDDDLARRIRAQRREQLATMLRERLQQQGIPEEKSLRTRSQRHTAACTKAKLRTYADKTEAAWETYCRTCERNSDQRPWCKAAGHTRGERL